MSTTAARMADLLARSSFPPPGAPATAAVSGGADSLAMLVLAVAADLRVTAVHVDHGLRAGSAEEADIVRDAALAHGARFRAEQVAVAAGPNLEARARDARRAVLPDDAMTGHTADDQAETLLLHLVRGAGLDGLAAMRAGPRKPILQLRRVETVAVCEAAGLTPVVDPTNVDPAFRRNRVRAEVLPLLDDVAGRDVVPLLARASALVADDLEVLDGLAADIDPLDAAAVSAAPAALARRVLRHWLVAAAPPYPPSAAAIERVREVARGERVATEIGGGLRVARTAGRLRLEASDRSRPSAN